MDSTKLLTEKLTLARELSILRPEVEYLRSQAGSQQSLLAEKLSLQRQLSTCQVELETERRSTQRALAQGFKQQAHDSNFESQLEELQAEVARERRERQKLERQAHKASTEWESQKATFESRIDAFKNKLRLAKDQLREEQTKKQSNYISGPGSAGNLISHNIGGTANRQPRKRTATQLDLETTIGTPGILPASKKSKRGSALLGDKSTFSITPFLNRTTSVPPDSPAQGLSNSGKEEQLDKAHEPMDGPQSLNSLACATNSHKMQAVNEISKDASMRKAGVVGRTKSGQTQEGAPATRKKPQTAISLEQVAEEENDNEVQAIATSRTKVVANTNRDKVVDENLEVKKRKRKILGAGPGRTLFDEDDAEAPRGEEGLRGGPRKLGILCRGTHGGQKLGERVRLGQAKSGFGTFSPLKRDKKTAVANA